ncbi:MAG: fatty acid desaturase, partial [Pseudomonadota bacterium]
PVLMVPLGIAVIFLFTLQHETCHLTPFRSLWLNRWVSAFCGAVILLPPVWFRFFHMAHHRHTHDPDKDPELEGAKPETLRDWVWHVSGARVWISQVRTILRNAAGGCRDPYIPKGKQTALQREAVLMIVLYAGIAAASFWAESTLALWLWIVPLLLGQPFLRLYLLAEHGRCPHVADMFQNTRTTFTNRLVRFFAWNMPFHAEHHAWPTVPFHRLPELHLLVRAHLKSTSNGYVEFNRDYLGDMKRLRPVRER